MINELIPFLWFDHQAEQAATFYVSLFKDSKILEISRCGPVGPGPVGSVLTVSFEIMGRKFMALNGGPAYQLNESFSIMIPCDTQDEIDHYWDKLTQGGSESQCGWLKDKFGLSWQICPRLLLELLTSQDTASTARGMAAMMTMGKLDIKKLEAARDGK